MFFRSTQTQAQTDVESVPLNTLPPIPSSNTGIVEGVASSTLPPIPSSNTISGTRIGGLAASGRSGTKSQSKTWATTVTEIPSWPEGAKPLKHLDWMSWLFLIGDVILVVLPIYFILLNVAVVRLDGKPTKDNGFGKKVESAIQLGPTIFPIMFAAISGRSLKMIARYLAERGAKLGTLELLMASQSVWGAVESQILMRRLTLVGANLLFLWTLSPLGGQASLRLLDKASSSNQTWTPLRYMSTGPGATARTMTTSYAESERLAQVNPLYQAAVLAPNRVKRGPEDTWGNVKIPRLTQLNATGKAPNDWIDIGQDLNSVEDYYSLVGIPVIGRPPDHDANFTLETSHLTVDCKPFETTSLSNVTDLERLVPGQAWTNISLTNSPLGRNTGAYKADWRGYATFFLQGNYTDVSIDDSRVNAFSGFVNASKHRTSFQSQRITYAQGYQYADGHNFTLNYAQCFLGQVHTETTIGCTARSCSALRIRKSLTDARPSELTGLDHSMIAGIFLHAFPRGFDWIKGSSPPEQFISNTSSFSFVAGTTDLRTNPGWVDLGKLSADVFSRRLAILMNTYYQLSLAPNAFLGDLPSHNLSVYGPDTLPSGDVDVYLPRNLSSKNTPFLDWWPIFEDRVMSSDLSFIGATANATLTATHEVYACNFAWLALLLATSGILLLMGAGSLVLKRRTLGPEMFGLVTSMTYENPYVKIPEGGSTLDAMERARLLKDMEVYIADVETSNDVGHVAFAAGVPLRKLERGRLYC